MSEQNFGLASQQNRYRGSRYPSFSQGSTNAQGNVTGVAPTANPGLLDAGASGISTATEKPSRGLTQMQTPEIPTLGQTLTDAAVGAGLPYAGQTIGAASGTALAAGSTFGSAMKEGVSALGDKVGGLFGGGGAGEAAAAAAATPAAGAAGGAAGSAAGSSSGGGIASSFGNAANIGAGVGAGLGSAAVSLLSGEDFGTAAKQGVASGAGTYIGASIGSVIPGVGTVIGGMVGGMLGGVVGGRVICTELVRQGYLEPADQRLDMEFTFKRLSNVHARGYLFWARAYVRRMRRSPRLTAITYVWVKWRLDEIKYQLGMSPKPSYPGKVVRWIMEPLCYGIGLLLPDTSESRIYKKESIA